jgi:hypothetical protein
MIRNRIKPAIYSCFLALLLVCAAVCLSAQTSASALLTATIINPIAIEKVVDMNFGNVAIGAAGGVVVLTPSGTRSGTGGVTLPTVAGTVAPASFNVTGDPEMTYSITLPSAPLTVTNGSNNMTVSVFESDPPLSGTLNSLGSQALSVGATLNVAGSQPEGHYVSLNPFQVIVNYN